MHSLLLCELFTPFPPFSAAAAVCFCSPQLFVGCTPTPAQLRAMVHKVVYEQEEMGGTRLVTAVII